MTKLRITTHHLIFKVVFIFALNFILTSVVLAEEVPPTLREKKTEEGYILNLKDLIKESKTKIERVDDKLKEQAKLRRNQQREEAAREYFEKAKRLYDEGKFEDAQEFWQKAIKITEHPEMKDYVNQSVKKTNKQSALLQTEEERRLRRMELDRGYSVADVEKVYQSAVSLYKQKKFLEAKNDFDKVDEMFPDHKATRSYLMLIEHAIEEDQQNLIDKKVKDEAMALKKEKDAWKDNLEKKEVEQEASAKEQAQAQYQQAVELFKVKDFDKAYEKFQAVEWILPNYKDTAKYLAKLEIERKIKERKDEDESAKALRLKEEKDLLDQKDFAEKESARKKQELAEKDKRYADEAEFSYNAAISLYTKKLYLQAKERFLEVGKIYPEYKSTKQYLGRIDMDISQEASRLEVERQKVLDQKKKEEDLVIARQEEEKRKQRELDEKQRQEKLVSEAEGIYKEAVEFYKNHQFKDAKVKFDQLQRVYLGYKSVVQYMSRIDVDIAEEEKRQNIEKQKAIEDRQRFENLPPEAKAIEEKIAQKRLEEEKARQEKKAREQSTKEEKARAAQAKEDARLAKFANKKLEQVETDKSVEQKANQERLEREREDSRLAKIKSEEDRQKQDSLTRQAEAIYQDALELYRSKKFDLAVQRFNDCLNVLPEYKKAQNYLSRIDEDKARFERSQREEEDQLAMQMKNQKENVSAKEIAKPVDSSVGERERNQSQKEEELRMARQAKLEEENKRQEIKDKARRELQKIDDLYQEAVELFNDQYYEDARLKFEEVLSLNSSHRSSQKYLGKVDRAVASLNQQNKEETLQKATTRQLESSKNPAKYIVLSEDEIVLKAQDDRRKRLAKEAEQKYLEAMSFYKSKEYLKAKATFIEVEKISPGYKSAVNHIGEIDDLLAKREWQSGLGIESLQESATQYVQDNQNVATNNQQPTLNAEIPSAEVLYQEAVNLFENKQFVVAREKLSQLEKEFPAYKDTQILLAKTSEIISDEVKAMSLPPIKVESQVVNPEEIENPICDETQSDFQGAVEHYKAGRLIEAKAILLQINKKTPCRTEVKHYLSLINRKLKVQDKAALDEIARQNALVSKNDYSEISKTDSYEWMDHSNKQDVLFKLKKDQLKGLEGERYQKLKEKVEHEGMVKKQILRDRKIDDALRRKTLRKRFIEEDKFNKKETIRLELEEKANQLELEAQQKQEEIAKKEEERKFKAQEIIKQQEEARRLKQEELEKKREEERLAKELKLKQIEEEKRKKQEELANQKEEERKQREEVIVKEKEALDQKLAEEEKVSQEKIAQQESIRDENKKKMQEERTLSFGQDASPTDVVLTQYEYGKYKDELKRKDSQEHLEKIRNRKQQLKSKIRKDLRYQRTKIEQSKQTAKINDQTLHMNHVEQIYQEAIALYREGRFVAAKAKFSMANGLIPGYKLAPSFVRACESNIDSEKRRDTQAQQKEDILQEKAQARQERLENEKKAQEEKEQARLKAIEEEQKLKEEAKQKEFERKEALKKEQEEKEQARLKAIEEEQKLKEDTKQKELEQREALRKEKEEKEAARLKAIEEEKAAKQAEQLKAKEIAQKKKSEEQALKTKAIEEAKLKKVLEAQQIQQEKEKLKIQTDQQMAISQKRSEATELSNKAKEERVDRIEQTELLKQKALKQEEALKLKKEKEEQLARINQEKNAQKEVNRAYQEFQSFIKQKDYEGATSKTSNIEKLLGQSSLSKEYVDQINTKLAQDKNKIKDGIDAKAQKEKQIAEQREAEFIRLKNEREEKDRFALLQIQDKIQSQEESLSKERKILEDRLAREKARVDEQLVQEKRIEEERAQKEKLRMEKLAALEKQSDKKQIQEQKQADENSMEKIGQLKAEKKFQEEQSRLAKQKEEELKKEREKVKKEFDQRLANLYKRALELYKQEVLDQAYVILVEIDAMSPSYQDTKDFMKKIEKKKESPFVAPVPEVKVQPIKKPIVKSRQDLIRNALDSIEGKL